MPSELHAYLTEDHQRLDALLERVIRPDGTIDHESYTAFRAGLLRHIGIEERILFPELRRQGIFSPVEVQLHRDHAALAALLMPPPDAALMSTIAGILAEHNPLEEFPGGLYERMEELAADELGNLVEKIRNTPPVRLAPHMDTEITRSSIEQLLREAEEGRKALRK
ncbi:MAG: hemerythrin domain-containing protein [Thermoanaerobaculia bacterium]